MLPSDEMIEALKESILLPMLLTIFDRDKKAIGQSAVKYPSIYLEIVECAEKGVLADLNKYKQLMRAHGMRIIDETRTKLDVKIDYTFRGYRHQATYMWQYLGAEAQIRVRMYLTNENFSN